MSLSHRIGIMVRRFRGFQGGGGFGFLRGLGALSARLFGRITDGLRQGLSVTAVLASIRAQGFRIGNERGRAVIKLIQGKPLSRRQTLSLGVDNVVGHFRSEGVGPNFGDHPVLLTYRATGTVSPVFKSGFRGGGEVRLSVPITIQTRLSQLFEVKQTIVPFAESRILEQASINQFSSPDSVESVSLYSLVIEGARLSVLQ